MKRVLTMGVAAFTWMIVTGGSCNDPVIYKVSPKSGLPGTKVTLHGDNFEGTVDAVEYAREMVAVYEVVDDKTITATVPNNADPTCRYYSYAPIFRVWWDGEATPPLSTSYSDNPTLGFEVFGPCITSVSPSPSEVGETLTVKGQRLNCTKDVRFPPNVQAVSFATHAPSNPNDCTAGDDGFSYDSSSIQVVVPNGVTDGTLTITTLEGVGTYDDFELAVRVVHETRDPNDTKDSGQGIPTNFETAAGILLIDDLVDWYRIEAGSPGPWGYVLELSVESRNPDFPVALSMRDSASDSDKLWMVRRPGAVVDVAVVRTLAGGNFNSPYVLRVHRIAIKDTNEPDDKFEEAKDFVPTPDGALYKGATYLCNALDSNGALVTADDTFRLVVPPDVPILITAEEIGLPVGERARFTLFGEGGGGSPPVELKHDSGTREEVTISYTAKAGEFEVLYARLSVDDGAHDTSGKGQAPASCKRKYKLRAYRYYTP